ncbi:MAG: hypothetical protein ACLRNQ_23780 [Flavonifractor plautii]
MIPAEHPCFSAQAHFRYGRIHLPVAPRCNIRCGYCDRRYDCANESRPGVTSEVISPKLPWTAWSAPCAWTAACGWRGWRGPASPWPTPPPWRPSA